MDWTDRFAARTACMKRSAIRELLKFGNRPGMISFAGGLPAPELFPIAEVEAATQRVLREHGRKALQYGETEGLAALRDWLTEKFSTSAVKLQRHNILITPAPSQASIHSDAWCFKTATKSSSKIPITSQLSMPGVPWAS